jgi:predicted KAP-like P-loop ATPase
MWNDQETRFDLLGYRRIAQTLISIMDDEALRPLTIGIHGSWGAGKSSVLSLIDSELQADADTLCFTFNSWLYQGYEDTRSALMEMVVHELMGRRDVGQQALDLGKSLLRRINWLKAIKTVGQATLTATLGLPANALLGVPGLLSRAKQFIDPKEDKAGIEVQVSTEDDPWLYPEKATVPAQIQAFRIELQQLIERVNVKRLVVLVDDLDRCLPEAVIDILEAVKLFLFVPGTVFIIAADEAMIEYAVRRHYPDLPVSQADYTKHYLEKLIQIPIRIPSLNQLQTQNYIRFLLLQNQLQNDHARLGEICQLFEDSRKTPYDATELTYEFITQQLGSANPELRAILHVAEQLGSSLAAELRGNPRNIKRFLNTVFLRKRVAEIYGLTDLKVGILSKLLLLERFHEQDYTRIILEVTGSSDGRSDIIRQLEQPAEPPKTSTKKSSSPTTIKQDIDAKHEQNLIAWAKLEPRLAEADLRPYVFVSREQAVSFQLVEEIPHALIPVLTTLASGARVAMQGQQPNVAALTDSLARLLFRQLEDLAAKEGNWQSLSKPMSGLLYLVQHQPVLETSLIELLQSVPARELGTWVGSNLEFFRSAEGQRAKLQFFTNIQKNPDAPTGLKTLIKQLSAN